MQRLINLTPHRVDLEVNGRVVQLEPVANAARVRMVSTTMPAIEVEGQAVPVVHEQVDTVVDLPEPQPGVLYVVSRLVAESMPFRDDLVVPTHLTRHPDGTIGTARALAKVGPLAELGIDDSPPVPEHSLAVLCGSQPLPLLLAIRTRQPSSVVLVHSRQTLLQAQRLNQVLTSAASPTPTHLVEIPDAGNGPAIRQPLIRFGRKWELDYTGGTKAMAAHARLALAQVRADADEVASYVDHSTDSLRFDNGKRVSLKSKGLTLASIATLHGGTLTLEPSRFVPDMEWLTKFARDYLRDLSRAGSSLAKADAAQRHTNRLRKNRVDAPWAKELRDRPGLWLEWLVHDRVLAALATVPLSQREAVIGARFRPFQAADDAEVDVLLRVGWRVRLLSCDTSRPAKRGNADHKKKALEAQARARQIGGDASRAALVTLLEPVGVSAITRHLSPVEVGAPARVFGQNDLQRWLDDDLTDLSDWCSR